jgi:hypothetical protein
LEKEGESTEKIPQADVREESSPSDTTSRLMASKKQGFQKESGSKGNKNSKSSSSPNTIDLAEYPVSAIITNWKSIDNLRHIVRYFESMPTIIREIIIINGNPDQLADEGDIMETPEVSLSMEVTKRLGHNAAWSKPKPLGSKHSKKAVKKAETSPGNQLLVKRGIETNEKGALKSSANGKTPPNNKISVDAKDMAGGKNSIASKEKADPKLPAGSKKITDFKNEGNAEKPAETRKSVSSKKPIDDTKKSDLKKKVSESNIHIINIDWNENHFGKYFACTMATYEICYMQDDSSLNVHFQAMHSYYVRSGAHKADDVSNSMLSITRPQDHHLHQQWMFANEQLGLHAGFSDFKFGTFIRKSSIYQAIDVISDTNQLNTHDPINSMDYVYPIIKNRYPRELVGEIILLNQDDQKKDTPKPLLEEEEKSKKQDESYLLKAVAILHESLTEGLELKDKKSSIVPSVDTYSKLTARSVCFRGDCIFHTSKSEYPDPSGTQVTTIPSSLELWGKSKMEMGFPDFGYWSKHHYGLAVDDNKSTCWASTRIRSKGDWMQWDFISPQSVSQVALTTGLVVNPNDLALEVSADNQTEEWQPCKSNPATPDQPNTVYFTCNEMEMAMFIRLTLTTAMENPMSLCHAEFGTYHT